MLDLPEFGLRTGFKLAYQNLLQSIVENDIQSISGMCEKRLYRGFYEGLQNINKDIDRIEVLNLENHEKQIFKINILD